MGIGIPASVLVPQQPIYSARAESLTENPVFQGFVLLLAATYAMLLYRNLEDVRLLLTRVSRDRATGERLTEDPGGSGFSRSTLSKTIFDPYNGSRPSNVASVSATSANSSDD